MTKDKANEWLKSVKGKKIAWSSWSSDDYIIPTGEWKDTDSSDPFYWLFWGAGKYLKDRTWGYIGGGFEEAINGNNWKLIETFEDYLEMYYKE